ncbi:hypothetical protein [Streptomyces sp. NPDC001770]
MRAASLAPPPDTILDPTPQLEVLQRVGGAIRAAAPTVVPARTAHPDRRGVGDSPEGMQTRACGPRLPRCPALASPACGSTIIVSGV